MRDGQSAGSTFGTATFAPRSRGKYRSATRSCMRKHRFHERITFLLLYIFHSPLRCELRMLVITTLGLRPFDDTVSVPAVGRCVHSRAFRHLTSGQCNNNNPHGNNCAPFRRVFFILFTIEALCRLIPKCPSTDSRLDCAREGHSLSSPHIQPVNTGCALLSTVVLVSLSLDSCWQALNFCPL